MIRSAISRAVRASPSGMKPLRIAAVRAPALHAPAIGCLPSVVSAAWTAAPPAPAARGMATGPQLTGDTISPLVAKAEYAVRGAIVIRAMGYAQKLAAGGAEAAKLPFKKLVFCNIGNPQSLEQKPITFFREVLSLVNHPALLGDPKALEVLSKVYAPDAIQRAVDLVATMGPGGVGAYSESQGIPVLRKAVSEFIARRDGYPSNPAHIFLTDGASPAVQNVLKVLIRDDSDTILIPIPQYPLYSGAIAMLGGHYTGYYQDEDSTPAWGVDIKECERALAEARAAGKNARALVVINPGNPTGSVMSEANMREVVDLCVRERLVLFADEVYQDNIWADDAKWVSFKKVAADMGVADVAPASGGGGGGDGKLQLASFHSISKGFYGECGHRGGYAEMVNVDADVLAAMYKIASVSLCSNVDGQVMMSLVTNPPKEGEPSYKLYCEERDAIQSSLRRRARALTAAFEKIDGIHCASIAGAMYAFPRVDLPAKAVAAAKEKGMAPDAMYCTELLDHTGIVVVPGSGFGQRDGTWHFRTTILPPERDMEHVASAIGTFHADFNKRYA